MRRSAILIMILLSLLTTSIVVGSQEKDIYLNTGGKIGHLIYIEQYYSTSDNNTINLEQERTYFDGAINTSKVKFMVIRPLDKQGNQYPENKIRTIATLDSVTILNTWYTTDNITTTEKTQATGTMRLIGLATIIAVLLMCICLIKLVLKKRKKRGESLSR